MQHVLAMPLNQSFLRSDPEVVLQSELKRRDDSDDAKSVLGEYLRDDKAWVEAAYKLDDLRKNKRQTSKLFKEAFKNRKGKANLSVEENAYVNALREKSRDLSIQEKALIKQVSYLRKVRETKNIS